MFGQDCLKGTHYFTGRGLYLKKPTAIAELQAPPAHLVEGYQRCNPPGVPMFYAASKRVGALLEIGVTEGSVVYLGQWMGRDRIPVNKIFDSNESKSSTLSGPNDDLLLAFLDTQFTRRIHENFANDYKFTAAIAQQLTSGFPPNDEHDVHADGHVALEYPSVRGLDLWYNTAMHAGFAAERLELLHVMELRVLSHNGDSVRVEVLDTATSFDEGAIQWSSDPSRLPTLLQEHRGVPFVYDGQKWNLQLFDGPVTPDHVDALLVD